MTLYWGADHEVPQSQVSEPSHLWYFHIDTYLHFLQNPFILLCVFSAAWCQAHRCFILCVIHMCTVSMSEWANSECHVVHVCTVRVSECTHSERYIVHMGTVSMSEWTNSECRVIHVCTVRVSEWTNSEWVLCCSCVYSQHVGMG